MTHATLRNFPASRNTEKSYSACKSIGSLLRAAASTVRPIRSLRGWPLRLVIAAIAALKLAAPGAVMGNGGCQFPPSMAGLAHVVATAPSGPIQKTSRAPSSLVTAAMGELAALAPGGVIGKAGCQFPPSMAGLAHVVAAAPSGPIQKTSRAPANLVIAVIGELLSPAWDGPMANAGRHVPLSTA